MCIMTRSDDASTDVLSSLPIIACCVVSVMILLVSFSHAMSRGSSGSGSDALAEECRRIISLAFGELTSESQDGRRYLANDWADRLTDIEFFPETPLGESASIELRLFDHAASEFPLAGNVSSCPEVRTISEPVILVDRGRAFPGEMIVKVGR